MRALLPLTALVLLPGCETANGTGPSAAAPPFVATAVGRIDSEEEARNLVAAADGTIARILVARGEPVRAGQPLLTIDCAPRLAATGARGADADRAAAAALRVREGARYEEIDAASASLTAAQSVARNQQQRLDQAEALIERGFISKRERDARTNERDAALAGIAAAEARLAELQNGSRASERAEAAAAARAARGEAATARALADQCMLRSPIDGQVLQILRREGEFSGASQGTPLIVVGNLSRLIVRAEINERDAARVVPGQKAEIWVEGQRTRWQGRVTHLASVMGRRSARSLDPTDRFDRDVREAFVAFEGATPPALVGLRVTVGLKH